MSDLFWDAAERADLVNALAAERGVAGWVVEKDAWVCWTLARLFEVPGLPEMTFKGGTSLSKVYSLIDRFSEDIDLTFSRATWGFDGDRDPLAEGLSGKRRQQLVDEVVACSEAVVRDRVVPALREAAGAIGVSPDAVQISPTDRQAVWYSFPAEAAGYGYGAPVVKIEFGARGDPWPTIARTVRPYLDERWPGLTPSATVAVSALAPERTFWEKATLLHALHHGTLAKPDKACERASRHLYDIHRLWTTDSLRSALIEGPLLLDRVVANKQVFFREGKARYELVTGRQLAVVPHPALEAALRRDYAGMQSMFFPGTAVPAWEELRTTAMAIERVVAGW